MELINNNTAKIKIFTEGFNENNGGTKATFALDHCTDAGNHYITIKLPWLFIIIEKYLK